MHKNKIIELKDLSSNDYGFILEDINTLSTDEREILINLKIKDSKFYH